MKYNKKEITLKRKMRYNSERPNPEKIRYKKEKTEKILRDLNDVHNDIYCENNHEKNKMYTNMCTNMYTNRIFLSDYINESIKYQQNIKANGN